MSARSRNEPLVHWRTGLVVELLFDHDVDQRQCQRAVGTGSDLEQYVRLAGDPHPARIDGDDLHAAFSRRDDVMREDQRRRARVVSPEQEKVTVRDVGRRNLNAKRVSKPGVFVPVADMGRGYPVWTAEKIEKTGQPPFRIGDRSAARRALGKCDGRGHRFPPSRSFFGRYHRVPRPN